MGARRIVTNISGGRGCLFKMHGSSASGGSPLFRHRHFLVVLHGRAILMNSCMHVAMEGVMSRSASHVQLLFGSINRNPSRSRAPHHKGIYYNTKLSIKACDDCNGRATEHRGDPPDAELPCILNKQPSRKGMYTLHIVASWIATSVRAHVHGAVLCGGVWQMCFMPPYLMQ